MFTATSTDDYRATSKCIYIRVLVSTEKIIIQSFFVIAYISHFFMVLSRIRNSTIEIQQIIL
jgi:hypothetical protein